MIQEPPPESRVDISMEHFCRLVMAERMLDILETKGIKDWQHYDAACDELLDEPAEDLSCASANLTQREI